MRRLAAVSLLTLAYIAAVCVAIAGGTTNNALTGNPLTPIGTFTQNHCLKAGDTQGSPQDSGANCGTGAGSVTSVAVTSTGATISVTGSPITTSGTVNVDVLSVPSSALTGAIPGAWLGTTASTALAGNSIAGGTCTNQFARSIAANTAAATCASIAAADISNAAGYIRYAGVNTQSGTSYTPVLGDAGYDLSFTSSSAIAVTIPTHASVAYNIGTWFKICWDGTGAVTVSPAGGVTIHAANGASPTAQYNCRGYEYVASDVWRAE